MTDTATDISGYGYTDADLNDSHVYLLPALRTELGRLDRAGPAWRRETSI